MIAYITTKYSGPTNTRGSRISAKVTLRTGFTVPFSASVAWDHSLSNEENHRQAVFSSLAKAGMIRGDYALDGFRDDDGVGHWCAFNLNG